MENNLRGSPGTRAQKGTDPQTAIRRPVSPNVGRPIQTKGTVRVYD